MLIRYLRFFVVLAEEQHFGRAPELCSVTQPIIRGHRFMSLTPECEKVLRWGRQILVDLALTLG